jgi:hypothetical protein
VSIFLLIFDRRVGLLSLSEFPESDRDRALTARHKAELEFVGKEIVLLEAATRDDLRRTHARYFGRKALDTLLTTASGGEVVISQSTDLDDRQT